MLGLRRRSAPSIWTVAFHCQQGDELTQWSSLVSCGGRVSHRCSEGLVSVCLSQPILQVIAFKPIYSQLQSEYISKVVPFALLLKSKHTELGCEFPCKHSLALLH